MKVPPRSMFSAQLAGTLMASTVHFATACWLLTTVCPGDDVFCNASIVGPLRMFRSLGNCSSART